jgi:single-stranded-DNA-specific exonuclease
MEDSNTNKNANKEAKNRKKILFNQKKSVNDFCWMMAEEETDLVQQIQHLYNLCPTVCSLIAKRCGNVHDINDFIAPTLQKLLVDPSILLDMDKSVKRVVQALFLKEPIAIYGDYDVDGACSSALLRRYFRDIGFHTDLYIPDRLTQGYGANIPALSYLKEKGIKLILMVDCGTTAFEPLAFAKDNGLEVIVLDHHLSQEVLPDALAIINPNRIDQDLKQRQDLKNLCAAGVCFLFLVALNRYLQSISFSLPSSMSYPDLRQYLDMVGLATVCDVMSLTGLNRAFVKQGLFVLNKRTNQGLSALSKVASIDESDELKAYHLGFVLGPRINAGGRVGKSDMGSLLLFSKEKEEIDALSLSLDAYNAQRQKIEHEVLQESLGQIEQNDTHDEPFLLVWGKNWHPGVIGIVAGRLKERFHKPTAVITFDDHGVGKGSGRSISGFDLGRLIHHALEAGHLEGGGGHPMAVGFSLRHDQLQSLTTFLQFHTTQALANHTKHINVDGFLHFSSVHEQLLDHLEKLEPYGQANPTPKFVFHPVYVAYCSIVGTDHLRLTLENEHGITLKAIAFRCVQTPLGQCLLQQYHLKNAIAICASIKRNFWQGRMSISLVIEDCLLLH